MNALGTSVRRGSLARLAALGLALAFALGGCAEDAPTLRVASKDFSESMILGEMIAQLAEAEGVEVERRIPLGDTAEAMEAVKRDIVDVYPEYNGTSLTWLGQAPTSDGEASSAAVRALFEPLGLEQRGKFGFSNDYAMVMARARAEALGVGALSELAAIEQPVVFAVQPDFLIRPADGLQQLVRRYGIDAAEPLVLAEGSEGKEEIAAALLEGRADVGELFMTDGQIPEYDLVVLEDDLGFFPVYEATVLARSAAFEAVPPLAEVLAALDGAISAADMRAMNRAVDLDAQTPASVATRFLVERGLMSGEAEVTDVERLSIAVAPGTERDGATARARRAVRAGFEGSDLELLVDASPLDRLVAGDARIALVGAEAFFETGSTGPLRRDVAEAFAVLEVRTAHLLGASDGADAIAVMDSIVTGPAGGASATLLAMMLDALGLDERIEVTRSEEPIDAQLALLAGGEIDGVFALESVPFAPIVAALDGGGVRLLPIDEWAAGGHAARYSFIRPAILPGGTYPSRPEPLASVTTQLVLAGAAERAQEAGEVGPGSAGGGAGGAVPVDAEAVAAIGEALGAGEPVDPTLPLHASLLPEVVAVERRLPFRLDISIANVLVILFLGWVLYLCTLPSPRTLTIPDRHGGET